MTGGREYQKRWMELWRLTDNVYTMYLRRWELSLNEYLVLESLREFPKGMQPAQLAERVCIQRQLVTIILNKLEERGFILRRESRTDHRRKIIRLNPAGRVFAEEVCGSVEQLDLHGLEVLSDSEREKLLEYTERFYLAILERAGKPD